MRLFITIFISIFLYSYTPQLSAIPLSGASTDGKTSTTFNGSAYLSSDSNFEEKTSFSSNDSITVDSDLTGLAGKFYYYVGYRLPPSGGVVYNSQALEFDVKQVQVVKGFFY